MLINLYPPSEDWSVMVTLQRCGQKLLLGLNPKTIGMNTKTPSSFSGCGSGCQFLISIYSSIYMLV